jgi:hypothetical protein
MRNESKALWRHGMSLAIPQVTQAPERHRQDSSNAQLSPPLSEQVTHPSIGSPQNTSKPRTESKSSTSKVDKTAQTGISRTMGFVAAIRHFSQIVDNRCEPAVTCWSRPLHAGPSSLAALAAHSLCIMKNGIFLFVLCKRLCRLPFVPRGKRKRGGNPGGSDLNGNILKVVPSGMIFKGSLRRCWEVDSSVFQQNQVKSATSWSGRSASTVPWACGNASRLLIGGRSARLQEQGVFGCFGGRKTPERIVKLEVDLRIFFDASSDPDLKSWSRKRVNGFGRRPGSPGCVLGWLRCGHGKVIPSCPMAVASGFSVRDWRRRIRFGGSDSVSSEAGHAGYLLRKVDSIGST